MLIDQAIKYIEDRIIYDIRHKHYKRTIEVADFAYMIVTGESQDDFLVSIKDRETKKQKDQRIKLTNTATPMAAHSVMSVYQKPRRNTNVNFKINHTDESREQQLMDIESNYSANKSFSDFILDRVIDHYSHIDPNAFMIIHPEYVRGRENEIIETRFSTIEIGSKSVIDYERKHGVVNHLMFENERIERKLENRVLEEKFYRDFYFYDDRHIIYYEKLDEKQPRAIDETIGEEIITLDTVNGVKNYVRLISYPFGENAIGIAPVIHVGVFPDFQTGGDTFVTSLDKAHYIFKDLIRDKSFFDLTKTLHTFLQKIQYGKSCNHEHPQHGRCIRGYYNGIKEYTCEKCSGSGMQHHISTQDIVLVEAPANFRDIVDLKNFATYVTLPHETPRFQADELEKTIKRVFSAAFSAERYLQAQFAQTATSEQIEIEKVHDQLIKPYSHAGWMVEKGLEIIAYFLEINEGLEKITYRYPNDLKIKDLQTLLIEKKLSKEAGVGFDSMFGIECDILQKLYPDDPDMITKIKVQNMHVPFSSKSESELMMILSNRDDDDPDKVLWEMQEIIFADLYDEHPQFHLYDYKQRKELIEGKVQEIIDDQPESAPPQPIIPNIPNPAEPVPQPEPEPE